MHRYVKVVLISLGTLVMFISMVIMYILVVRDSSSEIDATYTTTDEIAEIEKEVETVDIKNPPIVDEYIVHFGTHTEYINRNEVIIRNGEMLIDFKSNIFKLFGININYDNVTNKFSYTYLDKNHVEHIVTNYIKELIWYKDGLKVYEAECRSEEGYIPFRAVTSTIGYSITFNVDDKSITIEEESL